jgi:hypothetical protein
MADPNLAPEPQPQPAPRVDPQSAPRPKPKPAAAAGPGVSQPDAPAQADAARTARLLLRHLTSTARTALAGDGPTRHASLVQAAGRVTAAWNELAALSDLQPIAWHELVGPLASTLAASKKLGGALRGAGLSTPDAEISASAARLETKVDPADWAAAKASAQGPLMQALSSPERVELARLAIAAAVKQSAAARAAATKTPSEPSQDDRDRDKLIGALQPALAHIATAIDAVGSIARSQREALQPDVQALSEELSKLAGHTEAPPKLAWDRSFAVAFDSENQLRTLVALDRKARPYTGSIDPKAAMSLVAQQIDPSKGPADGSTEASYREPQAAVNGIALEVGFNFDERIRAIVSLKDDLEEPPPPKEQSSLMALLEIAINVALSVASGGLGTLATERLKNGLEQAARSAAIAHVAQDPRKLTEVVRAALVEDRVAESALRRTLAVDAVKDGTKRLFTESSARALARANPAHLNAARPLNAYTQHHIMTLKYAQHEAAVMFIQLASALGQLDLVELNAFARALYGMQKEAYDRQYDSSLREWLNFRAKLASPPQDTAKQGDPILDAPRKNEWSEEAIPGVLEIGLEVEHGFGSPIVGCQYLALRDGEPAAIRHLKGHPRRLADVRLNRRYKLAFLAQDGRGSMATKPDVHVLQDEGGAPTFVQVGVGLKHGWQPGSLKREELRLLKLFLSRPVTRSALWDAYVFKAYDSIPDEKAIALVKEIISEVDDVTTAKLEG